MIPSICSLFPIFARFFTLILTYVILSSLPPTLLWRVHGRVVRRVGGRLWENEGFWSWYWTLEVSTSLEERRRGPGRAMLTTFSDAFQTCRTISVKGCPIPRSAERARRTPPRALAVEELVRRAAGSREPTGAFCWSTDAEAVFQTSLCSTGSRNATSEQRV